MSAEGTAVTYYCWHCYARNNQRSGVCKRCGQEISPPSSATTVDHLLWATRHPDPDVAIMATRRLATEGASESVEPLRALVANPPDPYVGAEALRTLIALSDVDTERALLESLADSGPVMVRRVARSALGRTS
jgi:hypothetical protein